MDTATPATPKKVEMMPQRGFKGGMTSIKELNNTNVAKMKENELFEFSRNDVENRRLSATA
jgi:hypothetical protein